MEWRIVFCGVLALVIRMFLPEGLVGLFSRKPKALGKGIHKKLAIK
jgi:hypothetical protein